MSDLPLHVAILDDDPSIRTALGRLLRAAGMEAGSHATSDELYRSIAQECPDCLLLDLQMPGTSGLDVLKYLGQRHIHIPTIVITGSSEADCSPECLNAGAIICLRKPLDADQLIDTINKIAVASQFDPHLSFRLGAGQTPSAQPVNAVATVNGSSFFTARSRNVRFGQ